MLLFHLALRSLLRNRLCFVLLVSAVTAGVGFQIPNAANLAGYTEELLRQGLARSTGHLQLSSADGRELEGVSSLLRRLETTRGLRAAPRLIHGGVAFKGGEHQPVRIQGIDPVLEERAAAFCRRLAKGRCMERSSRDQGVVMGSTLAAKLRVGVGDRVKLVIPYQELGEVEHSSAWYRVTGVLEGGGGFSADSDLFLALPLLRRLIGADDRASVVSLYLEAHEDVEARTGELRRLFPSLKVQPWWEVNQFVANAIAGNRAIHAISMAMVVAAVMIPVSALLFILVLHEQRQIAILGALGFGRAALFGIYLWKAALVGVVGVVLGGLVGYGLCRYFAIHPIFAYAGFVVRPLLSVSVITVPTTALFGVTLLSGLIPAIRAARSNPATQLREE